tara:strand:+ start:1154 stop:1531 length:378 start_codon:yes stop_codon:yes gene_type:complete
MFKINDLKYVLKTASDRGDLKIIQWLLKDNSIFNEDDIVYAFHRSSSNLDAIKWFLFKYEYLLNEIKYVFRRASEDNCFEVVQWILINCDISDDKEIKYAFKRACDCGSFDLVLWLINKYGIELV